MFHDDLQTQLTNNWKRNTNEHPINRILTGYFNNNNRIRNTQSNNYKSQTKHIIQRQRVIRSFLNKPDEIEPSIRKPTTLHTKFNALSITSIPSPHLLFDELSEQSSTNINRHQTIKKELDRQSPILLRRHRPPIENFTPIQQMSDITNISGNQLLSSLPSNFIFRNKSSRIFLSDRSSFKINDRISSPPIKPLNYSKTISEGTSKQTTLNPKLTYHPTHTWTPILSEQGSIHTQTLTGIIRSKSYLSRRGIHRHQYKFQPERINSNSRTNYIQDLYISPQSLKNPHHELEMNKTTDRKRFSVDEWKDSKSSNSGISDDEESISADGNSSTSTCNSQVSIQQNDPPSSSSTDDITLSTDNSKSKIQRLPSKRSTSRRRGYNLALPPVVEHVDDDDDTDMKEILEKIYALQNNEKTFEQSINDEDSLTFQLLNQQETEFERKLSKLRKFEFPQK